MEVQVNTEELNTYNFCHNMTNDSQLSSTTGIESFEILYVILQLMEYVYGDHEKNSKISLKNKVIMTFVKLKHNIPYSFLAVIFNCCSEQHCQRIFHDTIKKLSHCLKPLIVWPSKEET